MHVPPALPPPSPSPNSPRFSNAIGKRAVVPFSSPPRSIPIIADEYVSIDKGTGALKVTPGHDPNDYALGQKYDLPTINIMNKDATLNSVAGKDYEGLDRFEARDRLWREMEAQDMAIKVEPHMQRVPRSQRGGEIIEPLVSSQWFVKTEGMGKKALDAVKDGEIKIIPQRFEKVRKRRKAERPKARAALLIGRLIGHFEGRLHQQHTAICA